MEKFEFTGERGPTQNFKHIHDVTHKMEDVAISDAYVADAARLAIREVGTEFKLGSKNEEHIIKGIEEALARYTPPESPQTPEQWKEIALISGEELLRDMALLGYDESDKMIALYREAIDTYLEYILEKKKPH